MSVHSSRKGFVVGHPAHLLTVLGMLIRWRPHILVLTKIDAGAGAVQTDLIREIGSTLHLDDKITFCGFDEEESYQNALSGNFSHHLEWAGKIEGWLKEVRPDQVYGDAFEVYNFHHDLGRLMLDAAVRRRVKDGCQIENFEFPLSSQGVGSDEPVKYGEFTDGSGTPFVLTDEEAKRKSKIGDLARERDPFVKEVAPAFVDISREWYRAIPSDRDYTVPPRGLRLFYDERGAKQVAAGKYTEVITFREHFVPIVNGLASMGE
ncbi:MAG: hypothetical protein CMO55_27605 [Verrucomicrobiales bacterium]|nr:hypothetical protein [Verrucomicrobiales bacterium]